MRTRRILKIYVGMNGTASREGYLHDAGAAALKPKPDGYRAFSLFAAAIAFALVAALFQAEALAAPVKARIARIEGEVTVKEKANSPDWTKAAEGYTLSEGAFVMTAFESSCGLEFDDGSKMTVKELTKIQISRFSVELKAVDAQISLHTGTIRATVHKDVTRKTEFRVKTPASIIAVRGTEKEISYYPGFGSKVENISGLIEVVNHVGQKNVLAQGEKVAFRDDVKRPQSLADLYRVTIRRNFVRDESRTLEEEEARLSLIRPDLNLTEIMVRDIFEIARENEFAPTSLVRLNWSISGEGREK